MLLLLPHLSLAVFPRVGVHTGDNRVTWQSGCCDGDQIVIDFRDENGDGNQGSGLLRLHNSTDNSSATYEIGPFWGLHRAFGPYCAPAGRHYFSFTSDSNAVETTVRITDSFGLIKARGGMDDFPLEFNTTAPGKFCIPADLGGEALPDELKHERAQKLVRAVHPQTRAPPARSPGDNLSQPAPTVCVPLITRASALRSSRRTSSTRHASSSSGRTSRCRTTKGIRWSTHE